MASPNLSELATTTIEHRSRRLADIVSDNTALLNRLKKRGNIRTFSGGTKILEEFAYGENDSFNWYSGYDTLNIRPSQVISSAEYVMKLCTVAVTMSGEEQLKNAGKERMIDLMMNRVKVAEQTMTNKLSSAVYSDGTGYQGKQLGGLPLLVSKTPDTGTVGNVSAVTYTWWRNKNMSSSAAGSVSDPRSAMLKMYTMLCRNADHPDLCVADDDVWQSLNLVLQAQQRYASSGEADMGFPIVRFLGSDVLMDSGIKHAGNSAIADKTLYMLNTKNIFFRPHSQRNMVSMGLARHAINQDATISLIGWAGNMTTNNRELQGVITYS